MLLWFGSWIFLSVSAKWNTIHVWSILTLVLIGLQILWPHKKIGCQNQDCSNLFGNLSSSLWESHTQALQIPALTLYCLGVEYCAPAWSCLSHTWMCSSKHAYHIRDSIIHLLWRCFSQHARKIKSSPEISLIFLQLISYHQLWHAIISQWRLADKENGKWLITFFLPGFICQITSGCLWFVPAQIKASMLAEDTEIWGEFKLPMWPGIDYVLVQGCPTWSIWAACNLQGVKLQPKGL